MSLEAELLALAGEDDDDDVKVESPARHRSPIAPISPKKRSRAPAKRSRKKARHDNSDDEEDVKDEDSDTLSDIESVDASSQSDRDAPMDMGSDSEEEGEHNQTLYPLDGKYKDHADKERLLAMTEIDREAALADRMTQIEREHQDRHLRNLLKTRKADKIKGDAAAAASTRKSMRTKSAPKKSEEATKRGKLDELRRNREERKATGRRSSFGDEDASKKLLSDGEGEARFAEEFYIKDERPIELDDVNKCRIGRSALAKLLDYPGFDEVVPDVFVRVSMWDKESGRTVYRLAQIKGFRPGKPYTMLEGSRKTDQHIRLIHSKSERDFPMDMMSDSRITEAEFTRYKKQLEFDKVPLPTLSQVQAKAKALSDLAVRPLTITEVDTMIAKRSKGKGGYILDVQRRRKLNDEREQAVLNGDESEIVRIDRELQELEDQKFGTGAKSETQMQRLARINAENRKRNQAEVRRAEIAEKRAAREALQKAEQGGGSFANPFMRVKTVVKFRHNIHDDTKEVAVGTSPPNKDISAAAQPSSVPSPPVKPDGVGVMNGTAAPLKTRKMGGVDDVIASMDLGIEIDI